MTLAQNVVPGLLSYFEIYFHGRPGIACGCMAEISLGPYVMHWNFRPDSPRAHMCGYLLVQVYRALSRDTHVG